MIPVVPVQSGAMLRPLFPSPFFRYSAAFRRSFTTRRADLTDDDLTAAREWLSKFNSTSVPRHIGEISFSRSGGPGGQNVNKSVPPLDTTILGQNSQF